MATYTGRGLDFPGAWVSAGEAEAAFTGEVQAIVDSIREDREPEIPLSFSRQVLRALRAACKSFHTGQNELVADYKEAAS